MRRIGSKTRGRVEPSPRAWAIRGSVAALALSLGYVSVTHSVAYSIGKEAPEWGHALVPSDGRIASLLAHKLLTTKTGVADRENAARIAHEALVHEPLAVPAIAALALDADFRGRRVSARQLFAHSDALSRRELSTRLWQIEDAVQRDDIPAAVRNYDIALRTAPRTFDLLFPLLAGAIGDPAITKVLTPTLAQRPIWAEEFIRYLSTSAPDPKRTADFFRLLTAHKIPIGEVEQAGVVNALVAANAFDDAWSYYQTLRDATSRSRSRDPRFSALLKAPTAFDWTPRMSDAGITASIQRTAVNGVFDFAVPSTVGGIVLEQLQLLPAGKYHLTGHTMEIEQPQESAPYWLLTCVDGREMGRITLPNSSESGGRFDGTFVVTGPCPAQILRLIAQPSNAMSGVSGQIDFVLLSPQ